MTILRSAIVAHAFVMVYVLSVLMSLMDGCRTHLVGKPHVIGTFREFFSFFVFLLPVFEKEYQPIDRFS
jgi:hypothetical protein